MDGSDGVKLFFTEAEWENFSGLERRRYRNMYDMYTDCLKQGIEIPKPDFMEANKENVDENVPKKKEKKKKRVRFRLPPKVFPRRKLPTVNYKETEIPKKDGYIYCDTCEEEFEKYCPNCGMLIHIFDRNVRKGTKDRAKKTLPANLLEIKRSTVHGQGVFALKSIPRGVKFGAYEGLKTVQSTSGYAWKLRNGQLLDAVDEKYSNWMRYVNCARHVKEQNLVAFQFEGKLYYRSVKEIKKGDELLVFYGEEFAKILSIDVKKYFEPVCEKINNTYACFDCCLGFSKEEFLQKHMEKCPYKIAKKGPCAGIVPCPFCKTYLVNKTYLDEHVKYCRERFKIVDDGSIVVEENSFSLTKKYNCSRCKYKTNIRTHFLNHCRYHDGIKPFECSICSKAFTEKGDLKRHIRIHTGEKPYECDKCQKRFNRSSDLTSHVKFIHSKERKYGCLYCSYTSVQNSDLKKHMEIHSDYRKTFECEICNKKFTTKDYLKRHLNKHFGIKFKCTICEYSSHDKSHLKKHYDHKHNHSNISVNF